MLFNEREMSLALAKLFELFSPSDYEAFDEEEIGYAGGLCLPEVCMALKDVVQTVYQYSVTGGYEKSFDYRGVELFNQRGCLILSDVEQMVFDEAETTYPFVWKIVEYLASESSLPKADAQKRNTIHYGY